MSRLLLPLLAAGLLLSGCYYRGALVDVHHMRATRSVAITMQVEQPAPQVWGTLHSVITNPRSGSFEPTSEDLAQLQIEGTRGLETGQSAWCAWKVLPVGSRESRVMFTGQAEADALDELERATVRDLKRFCQRAQLLCTLELTAPGDALRN